MKICSDQLLWNLSLKWQKIIAKTMLTYWLIFRLEIPDSPSSITFSNITDNSVIISWTHSDLGKYIVNCKDCPGNSFPQNTTDKTIKINNLGAFAIYQINVLFVNEITLKIGESISSRFVSFKTLPGGK